ncbi:MAG: 3-isopropylmalate dehydratase large subunit [Deferribacterales bacterium]|jgi:3-isopropylmalate/(R)-2-methylmalate dehydratase large subunit|uniref:3-isopropylmalate dehydratase large subunit n=1 Tax=Deferrivibrio essentukiensis TaxID=2880922 RepID=UPI0019C32AA4|nr:3-isopropylmalate dehydratase large subunit [Deferrivibrio essentukiensis]MBC7196457.1 3-isopropylmalate dehydratase large subunit [Deferribacterales bacterium]MBZ4672386.1 3-isopropylmalate dehydratase, large subunit [Deferribacteraceae bacterium]MCB4203862.1 3-isopropylmalate dehydratase large subunit [Deferrivibrio essentukiensis]
MGKNLFQKVWDIHKVADLPGGRTQLFIGLHLIHEVTSPQAFAMIKELGLKVAYPNRTFATCDHIIPTDNITRPFADSMAEEMMQALEKNTKENGITFFGPESGYQGVVHIVGPELGLTQPGITVACGDSHTATHGAFGAIAFGIGTSQVRDVLATQTMALNDLKVRRVEVNGKLKPGVYAKDIILYLIRHLGVNGGIGYAYEFAGSTIENLSMEGRMTVCNMAIEGGARVGYVNPDEKTFEYLKGKKYAPKGENWDKMLSYWESIKSDKDAEYDDVVVFNAEDIEPMVTWGINPEQGVGISEKLPIDDNPSFKEAYEYMKLKPGAPIKGTKIDVVFIGSCTNGRIEDLREAAKYLKGKKVASHVKALAVPGSTTVKAKAEAEGLDKIFIEAGFEWRNPGCSMCLAMNPDKLIGDQICASTSNRNFKGRQGSSSGRTILMSPAMAAAAAVTGEISDAREVFELN